MKKALLLGIACFMLAAASAEIYYSADKDVVEVHEVHKEQRIVVYQLRRDSKEFSVPDGWHVVKMSIDSYYFVVAVLEKN